MANIYDTANQLEIEIRNSQEYKDIKQALDIINSQPEAKASYDAFITFQQELQDKIANGQELDEADQKKAQEFQATLQENELLTSLMAKEQALQIIINDIQKIVLKPVQDLYRPEG